MLCFLIIGWRSPSAQDRDAYVWMSPETYFDKTAGCVVGQIAGVLSGFEFAGGRRHPRICLPDEWFSLCQGPYGGGPLRGCAGRSLIDSLGRIASDDDYHVDFFNQLILAQCGPDPSYADLARMWYEHQVRDWGGGAHAMRCINQRGYFPPFTGRLEYGNRLGWCTESYIENETIGCVFPGMPASAAVLGDRFASVTGDFESQLVGKFYAVLYSVAYFETDAAVALQKALEVMPRGSWVRRVCDKAFALHAAYPDDWRRAARELYECRRPIFLMDNPQTAYDVNTGFTVLAILYGTNDFTESVRIASLIGYDADCTAATVGGLLGIIHGVKALPAVVHEVVWKNGNGIYLNDANRVPYIRKDYPQEQTLRSIVRQYQRNAEAAIAYCGGRVGKSAYNIRRQEVSFSRVVYVENSDFEAGDRNLCFQLAGDALAQVDTVTAAHNGLASLQVTTSEPEDRAEAYFEVRDLKIGITYRLSAYLMAEEGCRSMLFVDGKRTPYASVASYGNDSLWVHRSLLFEARDSVLRVGLRGDGKAPGCCYLDDLSLREYGYERLVALDAAALAKKTGLPCVGDDLMGNPVAIDSQSILRLEGLEIPRTQEYLLRIFYANGTADMVDAALAAERPIGKIGFPATGSGENSNVLEVPIRLKAGKRCIVLNDFSAPIRVVALEIIAPDEFEIVN